METPYAWVRLLAALLISTVGGVGMWSTAVVLPALQSDFAISRGEASLPATIGMLGFAVGGVLMGRLADRFGVMVPVILGGLAISGGYVLSAFSRNVWELALVQGLLISLLGGSAMFGPLMADISMWFAKRRGIAVAICASGNYLAGTVWPPAVQWAIESHGWRQTHIGIGIVCAGLLLPLALVLRRRPPALEVGLAAPGPTAGRRIEASPAVMQWLLVVAGIACCVAMSMPQVHIVAYCGDLGYGAARGAEMLALMLFCGIFSRLASGLIADRIGGVATLLLGSVLQGLALVLYIPFDGLASLYLISALFGFFQGGLVPSYALIVREHYPPSEAGTRVGLVLMSTLFGMALGGWLSGAIYDWTGSYHAAFVNGVAWNLVNLAIVLWLMGRRGGGTGRELPAMA
jgi:MFS family permease